MASILLNRLNEPRQYYMRGGAKSFIWKLHNDLAGMLVTQLWVNAFFAVSCNSGAEDSGVRGVVLQQMAWWCKDCGKMWGLRGWTVFLWCEECQLWQEVPGLSGDAGVEHEEV